jgi:four helix bundle protein
MGEWLLKNKSYDFSLRIVRLMQFLQDQKKEFTLSRQVLRSGTSVGAMVREAQYGQSDADYLNKLQIALKEANETDYWLSLLHDTGYIDTQLFTSLQKDCSELIAILISTIKTVKARQSEKKPKTIKPKNKNRNT